jgi:hypothetical protein
MYLNGSVLAWKLMIYTMMVGLMAASIISALRRKNRGNFEPRLELAFDESGPSGPGRP